MASWIVLAVSDADRIFAGNEGYQDIVAERYHWDSTVPNATKVSAGDDIAVRDGSQLLGVSVVDDVIVQDGRKLRRSCPTCGHTDVRPRQVRLPRWRCYDAGCKAEFDEPTETWIDVVNYTSEHARRWVDLSDLGLSKQRLAGAQRSPTTQQSIRPADWGELDRLIKEAGADPGQTRLVGSLHGMASKQLGGGFAHRVARVRKGQRRFRETLLARFGEVCAFSGPHPKQVLEAAHLYSYAESGVHHEHGGLLLRRDLHPLFDRGLIAVDPSSGTLDVADEIRACPSYTALHGSALTVTTEPQTQEWLRDHWALHRE